MPPRPGILGRAQQQPVERELAHHAQPRRHMAMRQRALDPQSVRAKADHPAALEQRLEPVDDGGRQLAQIGQRPLLRLAALVPVALAQQHGRRRLAIGHGLDEHARIESYLD